MSVNTLYCIDATLFRKPGGKWRMWYKDEGYGSKTLAVESSGLDVYRSSDMEYWVYQGKILDQPGTRNSDGTIGKHSDVVICGDRAYIIYFTHPYSENAPERNGVLPLSNRHTALQAAEIEVIDGRLVCDRDKPFRQSKFNT